MKRSFFGLLFPLTMIIAMSVMGVEIYANGMRNRSLIENCAWVTLASLTGSLIAALAQLWKQKH